MFEFYGYVEVFCSRCRKRMGTVDPAELANLIEVGPDGCLCFDCEGDASSMTPSVFWQWKAGDQFCLGGYWFIVSEDERELLVWTSELHMLAHAHAHACLSSSTYLNTQKPNRGDVRACSHCQGGETVMDLDGWHCRSCGTYTPVPQEFVIPAWILGGSLAGVVSE